MNPKVDAYLSKAKAWRAEMEQMRAILLGCHLTEELKWGKPCYTFENANVVILIAMKEWCAVMFCKGALLKDAKGILGKPGENTQAGRWIQITDIAQIPPLKPTLKAYIEEAIEVERAGLEVVYKETSDYVVPAELEKRFHERPALKTAFAALTPGRQRGYLLHFAAAKQSKTRYARIEKWTPHILEGKGMNDEGREDEL